jgi:hypothetical protein
VAGTGLLIRAAPGLVIGLWPGLPVAAMLALVATAAVVAPVFTATASGLLPDVLDGDRYVLARSVFNLTGSGTQILGLGIGGALLAAVPARWLLPATGLALTLAAAVARLGLRRRPRHAVRRPGGARPAAGEVATRLFATGAEALIVPHTASLGRPASAAGPLSAAVPAGMLLGEVLIGRFCPAGRRRRLAFLDSLPEQRRGQAFGLNSTGAMGTQGLVPPGAGALAAVLGAGPAMVIARVATVLGALALRRPLTGAPRSRPPSAAGSRPRP